jgi:hypothetical protein
MDMFAIKTAKLASLNLVIVLRVEVLIDQITSLNVNVYLASMTRLKH